MIKPSLKPISKKMNKMSEMAILMVSALTVRLELSVSRTRKNRPLAKDPAIIIMTKMMKSLVIICYTPKALTRLEPLII